MRILIVEDEIMLSESISYMLKKNNFLVDVANDGITGEEMACTGIHSAIILDRMLPGKEGVNILKDIRSMGISTPVLILTAKDDLPNRIEGLNAGADDYLIKPFFTEELLARVKALIRRSDTKFQNEKLVSGSILLDSSQSEVYCNNKVIKLTLKEAQLLELLIRNKGQVLTKSQILERIWGYDSDADENNLELYIYYLRKKLPTSMCGFEIITKRGIGYCLKESH